MASERGEATLSHDAGDQPRVAGKPLPDLVLAFLSCPQDAARNYVGAVLVADYRARPLEFSYVSPVRPTVLQKILYGKTLQEHVLIDVIARKLMETNGRRPDVVFVNSRELLAARRIQQAPVAFLSRASEPASSGPRLSTLTYDTGDRKDDGEIVGEIVGHLELLIDLLEPFDRIQEALKETIKSGTSQAQS
ncbi:MAG: hypothetical protein AMXMBFR47_41050 [Planctomycetota bacterium]